MSMFANKIADSGNPICPMLGCGKEILPGEGQAYTISPEAIERLGAKLDGARIALVHKNCGGVV